MSKPKILIFQRLLFKPSEVFISEQVGALNNFSFSFLGDKVLGAYPLHWNVEALSDRGKCASLWFRISRSPRKLIKILQRENISLIHAQFGLDGVYALNLAKALDVPLITTFRGFDATLSRYSLLSSFYFSWINYLLFRQKLAQQGDLFLCVSDYIRSRVIQLGFPSEKVITHYNGVNTSLFYKGHMNKEKIVLHIGRIVPKKGTEFLIRSFREVLIHEPQAQLVIIGDGFLRAKLQQLCISLELQNNVTFLGHQAHDVVSQWMQKATVVCIPSITDDQGNCEGLPNVLVEAAASNLPVVATQHSGIPEAVVHGETGFLVPEKSIPLMTKYLIDLLQDKTLCQKMGKAARTLIEQKFCQKKQTSTLENIYFSLL